jgi:4-azaleucine resistance transporter AzlC
MKLPGSSTETRRLLLSGVKAALPLVLGYIPVGMAFGVLARQAGLSGLEASALSLLVYAGASQFIAIDMLAAGAFIVPIVITTLLVNLRHLLMSSAIAPHLGRLSSAGILLVSAELTDESFAVAMTNPETLRGRPLFFIGLQITAHAAWVGGTILGAIFGAMIDGAAYGIPFALPALFICLLVIQLKTSIHWIVMVTAGASALAFRALLPGNWYIILAATLASALGYWLLSRGQAGEAAA